MKKSFVIIGAGPVGLWTGIQLKKRMPDCHVILYEKYKEYKRDHVLKIQHSSLFFGASKIKTNYDSDFFKNVFNQSKLKISSTPLKKSYISTKVIEKELKSFALNIGCEIIYQEINDIDIVLNKHEKNTKYIIANGSKSKLRENLFLNGLEKHDLQHIIEFKSFSENKIKKLKTKNLNEFTNLGFEYIGKKSDNKYPFNLRLFVSKEDYDNMPEATFKNPIKDLNCLPNSIKEDLILYTKKHNQNIDSLFVNGKLSKLQLSIYASNDFAIDYNGYDLFLTGDAAMAVPYFRALNSGFVLSSRLAYILNISNNSVNMYNNYRGIHKNAEFFLAQSKNFALNKYSELRKLYNIK